MYFLGFTQKERGREGGWMSKMEIVFALHIAQHVIKEAACGRKGIKRRSLV